MSIMKSLTIGGNTFDLPTKTSDLTNDSGFVDAAGAAAAAPVQSVNGQTGAVSLDADDVGALPAGTYVTPEMYGAVGDGTTDDTQAIEDALATGKTVVFGTKTYLISSELKLSTKQAVVGMGMNTVIKTNGNHTIFHIDASSQATKLNTRISHMTLLGNNQGVGIEYTAGTMDINDYHLVSDVMLDSLGYGIKINGRLIYGRFDHLNIWRCGYGIWGKIHSFGANVFTNVNINLSTTKAMKLDVSSSSNVVSSAVFIGCTFEQTAKNAVKDGGGAVEIYSASRCRFINCWFEGNFENTSYSDTPSELIDNNCDLFFTGTYLQSTVVDNCTFQRTGGCAIKASVSVATSNRIGTNQYLDKCAYHVVAKPNSFDDKPSVVETIDANLYCSDTGIAPSWSYQNPRGFRWLAGWVSSTVLDGRTYNYIRKQISSNITITEIKGYPGCDLIVECFDNTNQYTLTLPSGLGTLTHGQKVKLYYDGYPYNRWVVVP